MIIGFTTTRRLWWPPATFLTIGPFLSDIGTGDICTKGTYLCTKDKREICTIGTYAQLQFLVENMGHSNAQYSDKGTWDTVTNNIRTKGHGTQ